LSEVNEASRWNRGNQEGSTIEILLQAEPVPDRKRGGSKKVAVQGSSGDKKNLTQTKTVWIMKRCRRRPDEDQHKKET